MVISDSVFAGKKSLNVAVSGAVLEDLLAMDELIVRDHPAKRVLIGVDPWLFNREHGDIRWKNLTNEYRRAVKRLGLEPKAKGRNIWMFKIRELFSPDYTLQILRGIEGDGPTEIGPSASIRYLYERTAKPDANQPIYKLSPYPTLDEDYKRIFEAWLTDLKSRELELIVWLAPFEPTTYERLSTESDYESFRKAENYITQLCKELEIPTVGQYDPTIQGYKTSDFRDPVHLKVPLVESFLTDLALFTHD